MVGFLNNRLLRVIAAQLPFGCKHYTQEGSSSHLEPRFVHWCGLGHTASTQLSYSKSFLGERQITWEWKMLLELTTLT